MVCKVKATPDCILCMIRQALNTARVVTKSPAAHLEVMRRVCRIAARLSLNQTPAHLSQPAYDVIAKVTGVKDPYKRERRETNRIACGSCRNCGR